MSIVDFRKEKFFTMNERRKKSQSKESTNKKVDELLKNLKPTF